MIPKIIHYCWFGGKPLSHLAKKCIKSWKRICPNYEIIRWDESNFDINSNQFVKEAYKAKKWAFVSDYVRLYALTTFGGIYIDTDVEIIKPLDRFLSYKAFSGFESKTLVGTSIIGCEKSHNVIEEFLLYYNNRHFIKEDGIIDDKPNTWIITDQLIKDGLKQNGSFQTINNMTIFPKVFFNPMKYDHTIDSPLRHSYTIHFLNGSWLSDKSLRKRVKMRLRLAKIKVKRLFCIS